MFNDKPNPYYGSTLDGLVLIEHHGMPGAVGTPFGLWNASTCSSPDSDNWLAAATERLGLTLAKPVEYKWSVRYGPVWNITKDLDGNPLPTTEYVCQSLGVGITSASQFASVALAEKRVVVEQWLAKYPKNECLLAPDRWADSDIEYDYHRIMWEAILVQL